MKKEFLLACMLSLTVGTALATSESTGTTQSGVTSTDTRAAFEVLDTDLNGNLSRSEYEAFTAIHGDTSNDLEGIGHGTDDSFQTDGAGIGSSGTSGATPPGTDADTTPGSADAAVEGVTTQ